jgi:hypothetical protein
VDPYTPPASDVAGARPVREKSRAPTVSVVFAVLGVVSFWTPVLWLGSRGGGDSIEEVSFTLGLLLALMFHVLGFGSGMAAPSGRRVLPVLANVIPLAIPVGLLLLGALLAR